MATLSVDHLVRIAAAGGGFDIIAGNYETSELVRIASAASVNRARLRILQCGALSLADLTRISAAGKGAVWFEL